jgi:hypothetical protein
VINFRGPQGQVARVNHVRTPDVDWNDDISTEGCWKKGKKKKKKTYNTTYRASEYSESTGITTKKKGITFEVLSCSRFEIMKKLEGRLLFDTLKNLVQFKGMITVYSKPLTLRFRGAWDVIFDFRSRIPVNQVSTTEFHNPDYMRDLK